MLVERDELCTRLILYPLSTVPRRMDYIVQVSANLRGYTSLPKSQRADLKYDFTQLSRCIKYEEVQATWARLGLDLLWW